MSKSRTVLLALLACLLTPAALFALGHPPVVHAVLVEAAPGANSTVTGPDISIRLRFNSRIDAGRSRLALLMPDGSTRQLESAHQPAPDTLAAEGKGLKPGSYRLRWQVLASDGHITRGEVPFKVN